MAAAIIFSLLVWWLVGAWIGFLIGAGKGRGREGFWWGLGLGVIGWFIVALMRPTPVADALHRKQVESVLSAQPLGGGASRACPWCAETIKSHAIVCRFCGRDVEKIVTQTSPTVEEPIKTVTETDRWRSDSSDRWEADSFGRHELRLYRLDQPTQLVKDGVDVSNDPIPGVICW